MISVIIPVYNGERYINDLINNFERQDINSKDDLELVFIDDGSTDKTLEILNKRKNHGMFNISVFSQENLGVSSARNLGIKKAKGDFITFVDVDDTVTDDYFKTLTHYIETEIFDVLVFNSTRIKESDNLLNNDGQALICNHISKNDMLFRMIQNPTKLGVYNLLLKKDFIYTNDLIFPQGYKYYEDYDFLYRAFALSSKIQITEKSLYFYILQENSAMQRFTKDRLTCLELMRNLISFFEKEAPEFSNTFKKWGVSRIYWSILWQSVLAIDNYRDFKVFAEKTNAKGHLKNLSDFPDRKVKISSKVYLISSIAYYFSVKTTGKAHSKVEKVDIKDLEGVM